MDDYYTPRVRRVREAEFKYNNLTPTVVTEVRRLEDAQTFRLNKINIRSSTPTLDGFRSPGLSPIKKSPASPYNHTASKDPNRSAIKQTPIAKCHIARPAPVQQQPYALAKALASPTCIINVSLTSPPDCMYDLYDSSQDSSNNSTSGSKNSSIGILNRNLNVATLLQIVGLDMYADVFQNEGIDLERFMCIQQDELLRLGLVSEEHCKVLMKLQKDHYFLFADKLN